MSFNPERSGREIAPTGTAFGLGKLCLINIHVRERTGTKFVGDKFDNGTGRNHAKVEGEIDGSSITWREYPSNEPNALVQVGGVLKGGRSLSNSMATSRTAENLVAMENSSHNRKRILCLRNPSRTTSTLLSIPNTSSGKRASCDCLTRAKRCRRGRSGQS